MVNARIPSLVLLLFLILGVVGSLYATHNRAGEVTYRHLTGNTYEVTITTCTKTSVIADRDWLQINWGDIPEGDQLDSLERQEPISLLPEIDSQINRYVGTHTYNGPGTYTITVLDPNRNQGVLNIPNSVDVPFCIRSELIISPVTGHNDSVQLQNNPKEQACLNQLWIHNPGAFDPDGDRLEYSLVECRGFDCAVIPGYEFPAESTADASDLFTIDPETGDVVWDAPPEAGEFNIAILIEEFRWTGIDWVKVGSVTRDMQINVIICDNQPPVITEIPDQCIRIYDTLSIEVEADDPDGNSISLTAVGGPLSSVENPATFNPISGVFTWAPECAEVRAQSYQMLFKAEDNVSGIDLTDIETVQIQVVATPVENGAAEQLGAQMQITWDPHTCLDEFPADDWEDFNYKIYRRIGSSDWEPDYCETGIPDEAGYTLAGTVEGLDTSSFSDELGDFFSGFYCYRIVACWPDGAESVASEEFCAELRLDAPLMTKASVDVTDAANGQVSVEWFTPIEVDTETVLPPYQYRLYHSNGFADATDLIYTSIESSDLFFDDLSFTHSGIDTQTQGHTYKVEFYANGELFSTSQNATSTYLTLEPNDNQITLVMNFQQPWNNTAYDVYRFDPDVTGFVLIGTTTEPTYTDTGLINNTEYCYQVVAAGTYDTPGIPDPLENFSQEVCGQPFDLTPPCAPTLDALADCEAQQTYLGWVQPATLCGSDDVTGYNLYYAPTDTSGFELLASIDSAADTTYIFNENLDLNTIAGCFYVTALDSLLPGPDGFLAQNESLPSDTVCTDNCPEYDLPNIFTPNNDGFNDLFQPFPSYRFIDSVEFQVFNRWGGLVFETSDPAIDWDGTSMNSGEPIADGTYYYVLKVSAIRLSGIKESATSGYITVLDTKGSFRE